MRQKQKKVAIILGAGGSIGRAVSSRINKGGFITILAGRSEKNLKTVLDGRGKSAVIMPVDISEEKEVLEMMRKTVSRFGRVDALVNCAGSWIFQKLEDTAGKDFEKMIDNNLKGAFYCMRECIKQMKKQFQGGQIINISSDIAKVFLPAASLRERSLYAAIHGAIGHLAAGIQSEVGIDKIKIATIYTGLTATDWVLSHKNRNAETVKKYALKPDDIAHTAWMIINQSENSNITEIVIRPLVEMPR